ncbi:MAG: hypothetical protein ACK4QW_07255 [Alphaproteobacteria bacterium]
MQSEHFGRPARAQSEWVVLIAIATIAGSVVFACAAPFAAVAAFAALHLGRRDAFFLIGIVWAANQAIGYGFLGYPQTWSSVGWGLAIGAGAAVATGAAMATAHRTERLGPLPAALAVFAVAFAAYQLALFAATAVLPSSAGAFDLPVVLYVLQVNAAAFAMLAAARALARAAGLPVPGAGRTSA